MSPHISTLDPIGLHHILVTEIGIDGDLLSSQPETPLIDHGLDSIATVELGVVLRAHGLHQPVPEDAHDLSFTELAGRLCGSDA